MTQLLDDDGTRMRERLQALRELEPDAEAVAAVRRAAADPGRGPSRPSRRSRRAGALVLAGAACAAIAVAAALPGRTASPLEAAAAAAAGQAGPDDFAGYRYVDVSEYRRSSWMVPEEDCEPVPAGSGQEPDPRCLRGPRATFTSEGRVELWIDARWDGVRRDHGSRVVDAQGDPDLAAELERDGGRPASTIAYEYGDGPFAEVPLAELPTDPDALLRVLSAAFDDGRWSGNPSHGAGGTDTRDEGTRRHELAVMVAHLLAEANATPELRAAGFGVLARLEGVRDLGEVRDRHGRSGHAVELRSTVRHGEAPQPARVRVVFDEDSGDVLAWSQGVGDQETEHVLAHTEHVDSIPSPVEDAVRP